MTPDEDAMGALGDDPRLADPLRALQNLGDGPAPAPSEKLAAFLADPSGGSSAGAAGWGWVMKEKAARLSRAGKVLVIGGGIALAGAVSATAAWQVTAVLPSHDVDAPTAPCPDQLARGPAHDGRRPRDTSPDRRAGRRRDGGARPGVARQGLVQRLGLRQGQGR